MEEQAAIVAMAIIERQIFFKTEGPSTIELTPLQAAGLKSVEKWRKSAAGDHGIFQYEIFVIVSRRGKIGRTSEKCGKNATKSVKIRTIFLPHRQRSMPSQKSRNFFAKIVIFIATFAQI